MKIDVLDERRLAFLNALNEGGGEAEAIAYLEAGGNINAPIVPIIEQTLLHYAAINRRRDLIELLAQRGANIDAANAFGMSPIHLAVMHEIDAMMLQMHEPDFPCARRLAELGASLEVLDNLGRTPRDVASLYGPMMCELFDEVMK